MRRPHSKFTQDSSQPRTLFCLGFWGLKGPNIRKAMGVCTNHCFVCLESHSHIFSKESPQKSAQCTISCCLDPTFSCPHASDAPATILSCALWPLATELPGWCAASGCALDLPFGPQCSRLSATFGSFHCQTCTWTCANVQVQKASTIRKSRFLIQMKNGFRNAWRQCKQEPDASGSSSCVMPPCHETVGNKTIFATT